MWSQNLTERSAEIIIQVAEKFFVYIKNTSSPTEQSLFCNRHKTNYSGTRTQSQKADLVRVWLHETDRQTKTHKRNSVQWFISFLANEKLHLEKCNQMKNSTYKSAIKWNTPLTKVQSNEKLHLQKCNHQPKFLLLQDISPSMFLASSVVVWRTERQGFIGITTQQK